MTFFEGNYVFRGFQELLFWLFPDNEYIALAPWLLFEGKSFFYWGSWIAIGAFFYFVATNPLKNHRLVRTVATLFIVFAILWMRGCMEGS